MLALPQGPEVGYFMSNLTRVSKDCEIDPGRQAAIDYVTHLAAERGIVAHPELLTD
jgi:hypothetical protein